MTSLLEDRSIITLQGADTHKLLQGLITNDINHCKNNLIYAAMLNNKGRFLYDFLIFEHDNSIFLDCHHEKAAEIIKKLNFYKLRSDVQITLNQELKVFSSHQESNDKLCFIDPRNLQLGYRIYKKYENEDNASELYHQKRIELKIPDGEYDLTYEKSLILEFDFDNLGATNYQKGCYVGQELTARTHHTGQIRKKLCFIKINDAVILEKNTKISCENNNCGLILSSFVKDNYFYALALIKDDFINSSHNLEAEGKKIEIIS